LWEKTQTYKNQNKGGQLKMGVEIISDGTRAVFICNTSDTPFGVVMDADYADDFFALITEKYGDLRTVKDLEELYYEYATKEDEKK
jgi:hypothetical protein